MSLGHFAKEFCERNETLLSALSDLKDYLVKHDNEVAIYLEIIESLDRHEYTSASHMISRLEAIKKKSFSHSELTEAELFDRQVLDQIINYCNGQLTYKKLSDIWS